MGDILYVLLVCLASHWMLLLNDGFFWDDNLLYNLLEGKHYEELANWFLEMGLPINILFFRGLDLFFNVSDHRAISFITILFSAILLNELFRRYAGEFKPFSLVFVTLYVTLFPFRTTVLLCTLHYQVMLLLFILAVYVRTKYGANEKAWIRTLCLILFSILSFISFSTASILVLFYFFLTFEYFHSHHFNRSAWLVKNIRAYIRGNLFVLTLPVVYWLIKNTFFPTYGLYADYNKISFELQRIYNSALYFFSGIFKNGPVHNVATRTSMVLPVLGLLFLSLLMLPRALRWWSFDFPAIKMRRALLLGWSIAFLIISALPYLMVPTSPRFQGWESRHYLLFTLSLPVFAFIALMMYLDQLKAVIKVESVGIIARPIILCVALIGVISSANVYLDYQAISVKQWAAVENLKIRPELKRYSSFWVDDQVGDFSKNGFHWYEATHQNWYEWVAIFTKAWGAQKWYGNNIDENKAYYLKMLRYGAADINPDGDVCYLKLKNTSPLGKFRVVQKYWRLKYFGPEEQLRKYLLSIVAIEYCRPGVE